MTRVSTLIALVLFLGIAQGQGSDEPTRFGEGVISSASRIAFSPDGKTAYFTRPQCHIMMSRFENGKWGTPEEVEFSTSSARDGDPFLAPDGSALYFWSDRPLEGKQRPSPALWVSQKTANGWGEPRDLGLNINGPDGGTGFPAVTRDGTLYFFGHRKDSHGKADLYSAKRQAKGYADPENLGPIVNSAEGDFDAYVSPDESYLIVSSGRPGGHGGSDLYISTRKDGVWSQPRNLGPKINSSAAEYCPSVSPDSKSFFFTTPEGIYQTGIGALGLKPSSAPSDASKLLAPGVISTPSSFCITFTPDGATAYFARATTTLMMSQIRDGKWSKPVPAGLPAGHLDSYPTIVPDGSRLIFSSTRPRTSNATGWSLWVSDRDGNGWSAPREFGGPDAKDQQIPFSIAASGTLYFAAKRPDSLGDNDIYRARRTANGYAEPENLGPAVNSASNEEDVFVAPDERYLVFTSHRPGGAGVGDLYISMRKDCAWTPARSLGPKINTALHESAPAISPDGRLIFTRNGGPGSGVYQVNVAALGLDQKR